MLTLFQSGIVAPYLASYLPGIAGASVVTAIKPPSSVKDSLVPSGQSTDPAVRIYDLVTGGYFQKLMDQQRKLPSVTLLGRMTDKFFKWAWGSENAIGEKETRSAQATVEINPCTKEAPNECFCYQYSLQIKTPLTSHNYTTRAYAMGEKDSAAINALAEATQAAILVNASGQWELGPRANYTATFTILPVKGSDISWEVAVYGFQELEQKYYKIFNQALQEEFNIYRTKMDGEYETRRDIVIVSCIFGGGLIGAAAIAIRILYKDKIGRQSGEVIPLRTLAPPV
jgi:hypothetical protein